jgi:outer membrane lipopolysaccharide assembly protein LptE/RlpB
VKWWASLCLAVLSLSSCGYHVAGQADMVPKSVKVIAIPAFDNITVRYKLTDQLPNAIAHEFISRTRYRVVSDPQQADAVLKGAVVNYTSFPTVFDQTTGRASGLQVNVRLQVSLVERATGKVLFSRPSYEYHQRYEISVSGANAAQQYFEESSTALQRLSGDVARDIVSAILENF